MASLDMEQFANRRGELEGIVKASGERFKTHPLRNNNEKDLYEFGKSQGQLSCDLDWVKALLEMMENSHITPTLALKLWDLKYEVSQRLQDLR